jgi:hypothetical protein
MVAAAARFFNYVMARPPFLLLQTISKLAIDGKKDQSNTRRPEHRIQDVTPAKLSRRSSFPGEACDPAKLAAKPPDPGEAPLNSRPSLAFLMRFEE